MNTWLNVYVSNNSLYFIRNMYLSYFILDMYVTMWITFQLRQLSMNNNFKNILTFYLIKFKCSIKVLNTEIFPWSSSSSVFILFRKYLKWKMIGITYETTAQWLMIIFNLVWYCESVWSSINAFFNRTPMMKHIRASNVMQNASMYLGYMESAYLLKTHKNRLFRRKSLRVIQLFCHIYFSFLFIYC